mgnify:CR=1 FL=1
MPGSLPQGYLDGANAAILLATPGGTSSASAFICSPLSDKRNSRPPRSTSTASPFLRAEAASDTAWQAAYGLVSIFTVGGGTTQYGHWEQFCEDLRDAETAGERDWRYYPDAADEDTYYGPYRLRPESILADPMSAWTLSTPAGGCYAGAFEGHRNL